MDVLPATAALSAAVAEMAAGRPALAVPLLEALLEAHPDDAVLQLNLGMARMDSGRLAEARAPLLRAMELAPLHPEPLFRLARLAHLRGDLGEASRLYEGALARWPGHVAALGGLAELARLGGRMEAAVALLREALLHEPAQAGLRLALARVLLATGQAGEARAILGQLMDAGCAQGRTGLVWAQALVAEHGPDEAQARAAAGAEANPLCAARAAGLASLLDTAGRGGAALHAWRAAEAIAPDDPDILAGLAHALARHRDHATALEVFDRAIALAPNEPALRVGRGEQLWRLHRLAEAAATLRASLEDFGEEERTRATLALVLVSQGLQEEALAEAEAAGGENGLLLGLCSVGPYHGVAGEAPALAARARALYARLSQGIQPFVPGLPREGNRLRLGLLSAHFGKHPVGWLTVAGIEHLPREGFEVHAFSLAEREGDLARRFRERADAWHAFEPGTSDQALLNALRAAELDILVDLGGHGQGGRLRLLRHRAAPVQIKWVGSQSSTTGVPNMDWMLTDRWETPPGFEPHYTERLLRLADGYVCYTPPPGAPPVLPAPALRGGGVTFGCFNNLAKVTRATLACWGHILQALPESRLVLRTHALGDAPTREAFVARAAAAGLDMARVEMHGSVPHDLLLAAYGEIDISLDPFPYTGGLTVCESLWMGVPVLTLVGSSFAGRHAFSHLSNVGLSDWAVHSQEEYVAQAVARARDVPALAALRAGLRARMAASPLCDGPRFGASLAAALRHAWEARGRAA
jgi:predicted O-linked N-acetylglucosamine transferase (SPINDLY family)